MAQPLNQIIALVTGRKKEAERALTDLHQKTQKTALFNGLARTYQPRDADDTETLPPESQSIQLQTPDVLKSLATIMSNIYDLILTQDVGNTVARADVVVDGLTILADVPVTTLLYLEKQLEDLKKFYDTIPTIDIAKTWTWDDGNNCYRTVSTKHRTKRKKVPLVLYQATKEHPAQVQVIEEDAIVGDWTTVETSGALSPAEKALLLGRVKLLKDAVVVARERANQTPVEPKQMGRAIFEFIQGDLIS